MNITTSIYITKNVICLVYLAKSTFINLHKGLCKIYLEFRELSIHIRSTTCIHVEVQIKSLDFFFPFNFYQFEILVIKSAEMKGKKEKKIWYVMSEVSVKR